MTAPDPSKASISVITLMQDVKSSISALDNALALVEKFDAFLPAQYRTPLEDLKTKLDTVDDFLNKI